MDDRVLGADPTGLPGRQPGITTPALLLRCAALPPTKVTRGEPVLGNPPPGADVDGRWTQRLPAQRPRASRPGRGPGHALVVPPRPALQRDRRLKAPLLLRRRPHWLTTQRPTGLCPLLQLKAPLQSRRRPHQRLEAPLQTKRRQPFGRPRWLTAQHAPTPLYPSHRTLETDVE